MADICEICMRIIEFREKGTRIDYDEFVLCSDCNEEVEKHCEKFPRRSHKRCVRDIQNKKRSKK